MTSIWFHHIILFLSMFIPTKIAAKLPLLVVLLLLFLLPQGSALTGPRVMAPTNRYISICIPYTI